MPRPTTTHHYQPTAKTYHHHAPPAKIYPPPPTTSRNISTTTYHVPKNGPPPRKSQNIFIYNLLLRLLKQFLFLRNAIFLSVTEILYDKVLISSFFIFQTSTTFRSIYRRCSVRIAVLRNFAKFTGKHLCQNLFFNKVAGLRPAPLLKKRLWHRCIPVNFAKFLITTFLQNTSWRLLL